VAEQIKILDGWGLVAFFEDEQPSAERMEKLLADAQFSDLSLLVSVVNLGEVWYSVARAYSENKADRVVEEIDRLGIKIAPADWLVACEAARFKAGGNIAYADCFALALAKIHSAEVVTGDSEFKQFEDQVPIQWI
jgi:predicted nucleic acid-binding protein